MVKIINYCSNLPRGCACTSVISNLSESRLDAFQKKVFWLNCQSLGFIQEHKMSWPVLDMMSDQLKGGDSFYNAAPLVTFCCSPGHHRELVMQLHTENPSP